MDFRSNLETDCPDLSKSVISTILQNPRYSQTFLRDMQEERRRMEHHNRIAVEELQKQFHWLPQQVIEETLLENGWNVERAIGPLLERSEEFKKLQQGPQEPSSDIQAELTVTSSANVDLGEPIHVSWKFSGVEPSKYDWIGLFPKQSDNKNYYTFEWTRQKASGKLTFYAPNNFGEYEFRLFHGNNYSQHIAVSGTIQVGPVFTVSLSLSADNKEMIANVVQTLGHIYSKAWVGLYLKGSEHKNYVTYEWLGDNTELKFKVPPPPKNASSNIQEYEVRLFAASYHLVSSSNSVQIQS